MAIRNAQPIPYSSPIFYGEGELSFNEQIAQECGFYASPMCLPWDSSEDFCFQFKAGETGNNLITCLPIDTGTATGGSVSTLVDSTATFGASGITEYQFVRNVVTGDTFAVATGAVGATTLNLVGTPSGASAFLAGQGYAIYSLFLTVISITEIDKVSILADHSICFNRFNGEVQIPFPVGTAGNWYRGTFEVSNYSQGTASLNAALGFTLYTLPIASPGTFDWYFGEPLGLARLQFITTGQFTGCISLCNSEAYLVNRTYGYSVNGGAWTAFTYTGGGLQSGIIEKCIELPEGCDVSVCLGEEAECAVFQTIGQDGNWNTNIAAGISLDGNQVCFNNSRKDDSAFAEGIDCDISTIVTNVQFELTISGHGTGSVRVCIENNDLSGQVCSSPHGSNGVHTFTLSNFGMVAGPKRIIIKANGNNVTLCATLKYKIQNFQPETFACSECYHVKELDCETELTWNNDTNSFGHAYNTGYTNRMYVEGRLLNGKIVSLAHDERKGVDSYQRSFFSNGRKVEELAIDAIFPAAHQAIAVGLMHRNFYVNGVQYVKIGEYEPDYSEAAEIAPCIVEVAKKDQRFIVNPL
jgi:hypothetical protein